MREVARKEQKKLVSEILIRGLGLFSLVDSISLGNVDAQELYAPKHAFTLQHVNTAVVQHIPIHCQFPSSFQVVYSKAQLSLLHVRQHPPRVMFFAELSSAGQPRVVLFDTTPATSFQTPQVAIRPHHLTIRLLHVCPSKLSDHRIMDV